MNTVAKLKELEARIKRLEAGRVVVTVDDGRVLDVTALKSKALELNAKGELVPPGAERKRTRKSKEGDDAR